MRVLIIKLTSMGDLVHLLPALSDVAETMPGQVRFDWVIDNAFKEVASWHPLVDTIIPSKHRQWKKEWFRSLFNGELKSFLKQLRAKRYDLIIDAQNNIKSAVITRLARGKTRAGLDAQSVREYGAHWFYNKRVNVAKQQHAIARLRQLFSKVFAYSCPTTQANFSMDIGSMPSLELALSDNYLVFVTNASWVTKAWPKTYWKTLLEKAKTEGYKVLLPWGSPAEKEFVESLAVAQEHVMVLPKLSLSHLVTVISKAKACVCVDTGLGHIAAAVDTPSVSLYGPTDPALIGAMGKNQLHLTAKFECAPCYLKRCNYKGSSEVQPACFATISPNLVWEKLLDFKTFQN